MSSDCLSTFAQYFTILSADNPDLLRQTMALRYQVYCVEHGFDDTEKYPDGLESDQYDRHSTHSGLWHEPSHKLAAAVRLILADPENPDQPFPMEKECVIEPGYRTLIESYPRHEIAEISRFAVARQFRRRAKEAETVHGIVEQIEMDRQLEEERRVVPQITLGLFQTIVAMSVENGIRLGLAVMEPQLIRLLGGFGIVFTPVGPMVDYHGRRIPCIAKAGEFMNLIKGRNPDVWDFITVHGQNVPD